MSLKLVSLVRRLIDYEFIISIYKLLPLLFPFCALFEFGAFQKSALEPGSKRAPVRLFQDGILTPHSGAHEQDKSDEDEVVIMGGLNGES